MATTSFDVQAQLEVGLLESGVFSNLLQKEFKPKNEKARDAVEIAVKTLAEQVLEGAHLISNDVITTIDSLIAQLDKKLTDQINLILHNSEFQEVESAWRGLHYLVNNTETDELLKIRVMNISKSELYKTLRKYKGAAWDQSPIFKKLYEEEYGQFGGEPYGSLVADYYFDHSAQDVDFLTQMAQICAASHSPLIAGADPSVLLMESWQELANPRDLSKIFKLQSMLRGALSESQMMLVILVWRCHGSCHVYPMELKPILSKNLILRKILLPRGINISHGLMQPMQWH